MRTPWRFLGALVFLGTVGALTLWKHEENSTDTMVYEPAITHIEPPPPCPWRNADSERAEWFPESTEYQPHDLILSGKAGVLREKLGRPLRPEELAFHVYLVRSNHTVTGTVVARRIKTENGALEFVLGLNPQHEIARLRIQRSRETESVLRELAGLNLETLWKSKSWTDSLPVPGPGDSISAATRSIVEAIAHDVKTVLLLLHAAHLSEEAVRRPPHR